MEETKEKMSKKKVVTILLVVLAFSIIAFGIVFYMWKVNFYKTHFLPNTYINGVDCSELDVEAVAEVLREDAEDYSLTVLGRDEKGEQIELGIVSANDISLKLEDGIAEAKEVLAQQEEANWLIATLTKQKQNFDVVHVISFDESALKMHVMKFDAFQEENMILPENAYISEYREDIKGCEIVPEVKGTQLEVERALSAIGTMIIGGAESVNLEEQNCYATPTVSATDEKLVSDWKQLSKWLGTEVTYDWNTYEVVVDGSVIQGWIVNAEDGTYRIDEAAVAAFVADKASKYDTYGKHHKFVTTLGVEISLPTGGFGWKTNRAEVTEALLAMIQEGAVTKTEPVYSNTAPRHGMDDIGSSYVEADLSNQHLYLYYKGELVFETDFVSGGMNLTPDCVTPAGVFDITYKTTNAVLRGADYETPVSYWMPFYGNYGMHDATWRWQFGGDIFLTNGSHGCLNLPLDSAATIYNYMYEGYPVICYYY